MTLVSMLSNLQGYFDFTTNSVVSCDSCWMILAVISHPEPQQKSGEKSCRYVPQKYFPPDRQPGMSLLSGACGTILLATLDTKWRGWMGFVILFVILWLIHNGLYYTILDKTHLYQPILC
jgi:hypothetical protein